MKHTRMAAGVLGVSAMILAGCTTTEQGTGVGAVTGAGLGAIVGNQMGNRTEGALIGAAAGALVGNQMGANKERTQQMEQRVQQLEAGASSHTVWVTNSNGSKTAVSLRPGPGGQWIGPKGEYYPGMPTEEQLKAAYGF